MKTIFQALKLFLLMTILTGIIYPLLITLIAQTLFTNKANGSLISQNGKVVGSTLIGQKFTSDKYFWPRPSAVDYNPLPSSGSNLGPTSADLKAKVQSQRDSLMAANPGARSIPSDLIFASGSGLDPDISPEAAKYQLDRVARARKLDSEQKKKLIELVDNYIEPPDFNILGETRVNVLKLNLALDSTFERQNP